MILVDSNIFLDIWMPDPVWAEWSRETFLRLRSTEPMRINATVYAEISVRYQTKAAVDSLLHTMQVEWSEIDSEVCFLAGKAFLAYRRRGGTRASVLADFFIGAQAVVMGARLLTRDARRYREYFPTVEVIAPEAEAAH